MTQHRSEIPRWVAVILLTACTGLPGPLPDGGTDAGSAAVDSGIIDAGNEVADGGADSGTIIDAGQPPFDAGLDAGTSVTDAGRDGGSTVTIDGGTDAGQPNTYPTALTCTKNVGTGSGQIDIQQAALSLVDDDVVCIHAGTYSSLNVANITASTGHRITIQNDGMVTFSDPSGGQNLTNVTLSGAGTGGSITANGMQFNNISYRALSFSGSLHGLTLQYLEFHNIGDYTIYIAGNGQVFDGTDATTTSDLKILHNRARDFGPSFVQLSGTPSNADLLSVNQRPEIAYNDTRSAPFCSYVYWMGTALNADIHHNYASEIALQLAQHNGIVFLEGTGVVHHNYFRNYLGEGLRLWPFGYDHVGVMDVHDNIFLESMKYSPVEIQVFDADVQRNSHTTFSATRIFNNTAGHINLQTMLPNNYVMWVAGLVDTYGFGGGTVDVTNNLLFDIRMQKNNNPVLNVEGSGVATESHNLYFDTAALAGLVDDVDVRLTPTSPAIGAGVAIPGLGNDFYGRPHGTVPDIGAVAH